MVVVVVVVAAAAAAVVVFVRLLCLGFLLGQPCTSESLLVPSRSF